MICVPLPDYKTMPNDINAMQSWCKENVHFDLDSLDDLKAWKGIPTYAWEYRGFCFYFANEKYATLFSLRWL